MQILNIKLGNSDVKRRRKERQQRALKVEC